MQQFSSKIFIFCISDSHKHYSLAIEEFCKRLCKQVEVISIKPQKSGSHDQIIHKETLAVIERLSKYTDRTKVLLGKDGEQRSSEQFADFLEKNHKIVFIIGGPYWLDEEILKGNITGIISFGKHTLPHGLAALTLLEQIWRGKSIIEGREYHY